MNILADVSRLQVWLNQSGLASSNPSLYQIVQQVIQILASIPTAGNSNSSVTVMEVNTSTGPVTVNLNLINGNKTVIKDITGNAGTNNITINATVDGVASPVINTNYGVFRVYASKTGFFSW